MGPKRKRKRRTTRRRPSTKRSRRHGQVRGVAVSLPVGILKASYGITKAIRDHQTQRAIKIGENVDEKWPQANGNAMRGNRLIVRSCENV